MRFEILEERLYTLHDELSLFLVLLTEEHITSGFGAILPHKRQSLLLYGRSALGSSREGHAGTARLRWHQFLRLLKSISPGSCGLLVAFFPALLSRHRSHPGGHHRRVIEVYDDTMQGLCADLPRVDQVVNMIRMIGVPG